MALLEFQAVSSLRLLFLIGLVFVLAGAVKGLVGLGLPTVSMGLLSLMMDPVKAAALLIVPSLVTNIWQMRPWCSLVPVLRRLFLMQVGVCFGTLMGARIFGAPTGTWATLALGIALIAYAVWGLAGIQVSVPPSTERYIGPVAGALTGVVSAATGVFVIPAVPYLQALALSREEMIQAMGLSFTVSTLALALGLYFNTSYSGAALSISALTLLPALLGMAIGQYMRRSLSPTVFRQCFFGGLVLLGIHMIMREVLRS